MESLAMTIRYAFSLIYGEIIVGVFAGIYKRRDGKLNIKNCLIIFFTAIFSGVLELLLLKTYGFEITQKLYPLHTHLILFLSLVFLCKCKVHIAALALFMGYMAMQTPNWLSKLIKIFYSDPNDTVESIIYVFLVFCFLFLISNYFAEPVRNMMKGSMLSAFLFMILPILYYIFDYVTTVWTNSLYEGNYYAVQFIPFVTCMAHLSFAYAFSHELSKRYAALSEKTMLESQMKLAESEFENMRELNEKTRIYRHDMRHHFALLLSMAKQGELEDIKKYLSDNIAGLEAITPHRFCEDEMLNLVLSYYADKAKAFGFEPDFQLNLPEVLPLSNTEMCSMVSNSLENALNALEKLPVNERRLSLSITDNRNKLLYTVSNSYKAEPEFEDGLPASHADGHGYGTKSIVAVVNAHGGTSEFFAKDGTFRLRVVLPLEEKNDTDSCM